MIEITNRQIVINGHPELIFAGEIHYFRLARSKWEDRILRAKDCGCNAIASYIPWLVHQEVEDEMDVTGRFRPENDVAAFIDLCHHHGLWFVARPGPFIMAEMKNEGIPYWVARKYPHLRPTNWEGKPSRSKTLDYLAPEFLAAVQRWYAAIMPLLAERLITQKGPIIAVQLDNEVGMLSWVHNEPDLTEWVKADFVEWLARNGKPPISNPSLPTEVTAGAIHRDLGDYYRDRIRRYIAELRKYAEDAGVKSVPFLVNIHGSGGGKGTTFPVGISQLFRAYTQSDGYVPGSDHYLGELTRDNAGDLYRINAFMRASMRLEQPLTALEFEVGSGDYGETGAAWQSAASARMKVLLSIAQGNRLINYYLLAGGRNPMLRHLVGDGNDRVAFTGERHGFAAPIDPEGKIGTHFEGLRSVTHDMRKLAQHLATAEEEHDNLALGFFPDAYKTDFNYPGRIKDINEALEASREHLESITRTLLRLGFRYPAVDVENQPLDRQRVLVIAVPRYLARTTQSKLVDFVKNGGKLFIYGDFPLHDEVGNECHVLADALEVAPLEAVRADGDYHLSFTASSWAKDEPEVRSYRAVPFANTSGVFLHTSDSGHAVGFERTFGSGQCTAITGGIPAHLSLFGRVIERLGAKPAINSHDDSGGTWTTTMKSADGHRYACIINLDHEPKNLRWEENGQPMSKHLPTRIGGRYAEIVPL